MAVAKNLVLSIFPGIDILGRGFEEEGYCVVRGPDPLWGGDIHDFHPPAGVFEGVIGGPPCQAFSPLANISHETLNLIPEYERVVGEAKPRWFLMENVMQAPEPSVLGYIVRLRVLNNRWLGEAQNRKRAFSFGTREGYELHPLVATFEHLEWKACVTSAHGGERRTHSSHRTGGKIQRYKLEDACELQGVERNFFEGTPFTRHGALKLIANAVPLPMARAVAQAVRKATEAAKKEAS